MKAKFIFAVTLLLLTSPALLQAAEKADAKAGLAALVGKINAKLAAGQITEAQLAGELREFDTLLAAHEKEKTDDVSEILLMKATLYVEIFRDAGKALPLIQKIKTDFPKTTLAREADQIIAALEKQVAIEQIQRSLALGTVFPDFNEKDTAGRPLSIANYKGKVVLIDFWATWCGPCVAELPGVVKVYEQYHAQGFEIIGISLDRDGDGPKLARFTKDYGMPWPQFFDGGDWGNKLAVKYGVNRIPISYLLDGQGKIIGKDLAGMELAEAVAKALAQKSP